MSMVVYKVEGSDSGRWELLIVENNADELPRRAAYQQLGFKSDEPQNSEAKRNLTSKAQDLQGQLNAIALVASAMLEALKTTRPSAVVLEFGVSLDGITGVPLLTEGTSKANLKIQLNWQAQKSS